MYHLPDVKPGLIMDIKDFLAQIPSVGVEEMDSQHRDYGRLIAKIKEIEDGGGDIARLKDVLMELEKLTLYHFQCEENLMREYSFPGYKEHEAKHDNLMTALNRYITEIDTPTFNIGEFYRFVCDWVLEHTLELDTELGAFIAERRN
ncbi:hypothetical protein BVX97_02335 [bacterium E08(2017)]|nr:hypothetical protein BVX97_02335 [bacterium E08(2017)]